MTSILESDLYQFGFGPDETDDATPRGMVCELKKFDSRYNSEGDRVILETGTKDEDDWEGDERAHDAALVLTRVFDHKKELSYTQLEVRSPHIREALRRIITEYPGIDFQSRSIVIRGLPKCIFHYRKEFDDYGRTLRHPEEVRHVVFALRYMQHALRSQIAVFQNFVESRWPEPSLDFSNLWMLFRPGDLVYHRGRHENDVVSRLRSMEMACDCTVLHCRNHYWIVRVASVSFDGSDFGFVTRRLEIHPYDGFKRLDQLFAFPFDCHPRKQEIAQALEKRGNRFTSLRESHHLQYDGIAEIFSPFRQHILTAEVDEFPTHLTKVKSRVLIDSKTFGMSVPSEKVTFNSDLKVRKITVDAKGCPELNREDVLTCEPIVPGFCFSNKRWGWFLVDLLEEVVFNSEAFGALLLPEHQKASIESLVRVHAKGDEGFDDVIKGKGKGMIFLLHGVPGVGKTLTAESIADFTRRPLYTIGPGDLGTDTQTVEEKLSTALSLATTWKAIILIDEADVLLAQRDNIDLQRNGLVSVFLRLLEYYEGIMFLTTNRMNTIDSAFKSRIHLAIRYQALSVSSRQILWKTFIGAAVRSSTLDWLDDRALAALGSKELNGRQIKNAVRAAHALAVSSETELSMKYLMVALEALEAFDADFGDGVAERNELPSPQLGQKRPRRD